MTNLNRILSTLLFFLLAALCEIGGGYSIWLWLREDLTWILGVAGGFILFLYGIIPTLQPSFFHRIYAAYGGCCSWGRDLVDGELIYFMNTDNNYDISNVNNKNNNLDHLRKPVTKAIDEWDYRLEGISFTETSSKQHWFWLRI